MQASTVEPVETGAIVTQAQTLTIASHADNEAAGRFMVECKALRQKVCDNYDPAIEAAHHAHKAMLAAKNEHIKPLDEAMALVKGKVKLFVEDQERERQEDQRRVEAHAAAVAQGRRIAELAAATTAKERKAIAATPIVVAPVVVAPAPKVAGVSTKKRWTAQIVDVGLIPRKYLIPDTATINRVVTALGAMHDIPGVKAVEVTDVVIRK